MRGSTRKTQRVGGVQLLALCAGFAAACAAPAPPPTPTDVPATPTPAATPYPTLDANTIDIQDAFLANVNDLTDAIESLARAECAEITAETRDNPTELTEMHGFAATLQRLGTSQPALSTSNDVRSSLDDLSKAVQQLDGALAQCGIRNP